MHLVVQKFGGTSLADTGRIQNIAKIISIALEYGPVVVITSAMSGFTNQLVSYTEKISTLTSNYSRAEKDNVISVGEQITAGLLALALQEIGIKSRSYLGWQIPIYTNYNHGRGSINKINVDNLRLSLSKDEVPILTGFQGTHNNRIVTLGRGGSDTTAVAVAAALRATRCDIYTDVEGVYSADPRIVPEARLLRQLSYHEMLVMAGAGAQIIHPRAVAIAMQYDTPLRVLSSFHHNNYETKISREKMELDLVTAIVNDNKVAQIIIETHFKVVRHIVQALHFGGVTIDSLSHCDIQPQISLILPLHSLNSAKESLIPLEGKYFDSISINTDISRITVVGVGIKNDLQIINRIFCTLEHSEIKLLSYNMSEIQITLIIKSSNSIQITRALHREFGLEERV